MIGAFKIGGSESENAFLLDGKAYPFAPALEVPLGGAVRLRLINAGAEESHVMHLHGYTFRIVAMDGNPLPSPIEANTITLAPSQTADIVFTADHPGKWMFHCHILDHMINPGPYGDGSADHMAAMGGLVTFVEVTANVPSQKWLSRRRVDDDARLVSQRTGSATSFQLPPSALNRLMAHAKAGTACPWRNSSSASIRTRGRTARSWSASFYRGPNQRRSTGEINSHETASD